MKTRDWGKYVEDNKKQLEARLAEADHLLVSIQEKLTESETNRKQGADVLASINQSYQQVVKLITDTNTDLAQVATLRATALDPTTGIEAVLAKVTAVAERAEKTAEIITQLSQTASSNADGVKQNLADAKKGKESIAKLEIDAQNLLAKLQDTYQIAVNTGLAGSFDERRKKIEDDFVNKWSKRFAISLAALGIIAVIILAITLAKNGFSVSSIIFFRLSLLTPLIFYTGYTAVQYAKERALLEKYAFKAAVAASLQSYTDLLKNQFKDKYDDKIVNFVLASMASIYSEPHEVIKKRVYDLSLKGNKIAELKAELAEDIQQAKDLIDKGLPDDKI